VTIGRCWPKGDGLLLKLKCKKAAVLDTLKLETTLAKLAACSNCSKSILTGITALPNTVRSYEQLGRVEAGSLRFYRRATA
jgi:hypothetical protein